MKQFTVFSLQIKLRRKYQPLYENKSKVANGERVSKYLAGTQEYKQPQYTRFCEDT
jgi:hypothetical protein